MRGIRYFLAASLAVALVGITIAQPPGGRPGGGGRGGMQGGMMMRGGGGAMLLGNESVQTELKITDDQKAKIKDVTEKQREKMREFGQQMRDGGEVDREKMQAAMKEMTESGEKIIKEILNPDQQKRLKQILWQQAGVLVFADKDFASALKISDEQSEKFKTISEEFQEDMREIRQTARGNQQEAQQKMEALRKEVTERAMDVLTAEQKKQHKEMLGVPFELKFDPNAMRGGEKGGDRGGFRKGGEKKGDPPAKDGATKERLKRGDGV
ncbi:MAG: Spy/CpxP family protein refolding chaperone [Gemmataceae bacterium]|nr:Spy/CpxP family protein refolding chaperone [Gemmataceae bacterium]